MFFKQVFPALQTGESVINAASGAVDAVKSTTAGAVNAVKNTTAGAVGSVKSTLGMSDDGSKR